MALTIETIDTFKSPDELEKHLAQMLQDKNADFKCILYTYKDVQSLLGLDFRANQIFHMSQLGRAMTSTPGLMDAIKKTLPADIAIIDISRQDLLDHSSIVGGNVSSMLRPIDRSPSWIRGAQNRIEAVRTQTPQVKPVNAPTNTKS